MTSVVFLCVSIAVSAVAGDRTAFVVGDASAKHDFRSPGGGMWYETSMGRVTFTFRETSRTADAVLLADTSRNIWIRLTEKKVEFSTDEVKYAPLGQGSWVDYKSLPDVALPKPTDGKVRLIYFIPTDRKPTANYEAKIRTLMQFVADFYRDDLRAKGYKTDGPQFETANGKIVVHLVKGSKNARYYNGHPNYDDGKQFDLVLKEVPQTIFEPTTQMGVIFTEVYESEPAPAEWNGGIARGGARSDDGGTGFFSAWLLQDEFCPTTVAGLRRVFADTTPVKGRTAMGHGGKDSPRFEFVEDGVGAVIHELGHALGLPHDWDPRSIMGSGFRDLRANVLPNAGLPKVYFIPESARMLMSHRALNPALDRTDVTPPTCKAEVLGKAVRGMTTIGLKVTVTDDKALRAMLVYVENAGSDYVAGGQELSGTEQTFTLDLKLHDFKRGPMMVNVTVSDQGGNRTTTRIPVGQKR